MDVIHGYKTTFPNTIGIILYMGYTADRTKCEDCSHRSQRRWYQLDIFSPMVDIARDPRWGRIAEGSGEDPSWGRNGESHGKGYQGNDLSKPNTIMSCVKHYALYGAAEAGRDYNTTDMSRVRCSMNIFRLIKQR